MDWRAESGKPVDEELKDRVLQKVDEGNLSIDDIGDYFTAFVQIANNTEDIQDEMRGFTKSFQIKIDGNSLCWMQVRDGVFDAASGELPGADIVLNMDEETAVGIFSGRLDPTSAFMCGDLEIDGIISDAVRFKDLLDMVQDEMD